MRIHGGKFWAAVVVTSAISVPAAAATFNFTGSNLSGAVNEIPINANSGGAVGVISAVAFDPTSTSGGQYDRLYFTNRESGDGGLYVVDLSTQVVTGALALTELTNASSVAVDSAGTVYVGQDTGPGVWRVENPLGTPNVVQMLGNYSLSTDDDPISIDVIPGSNKLFVLDQGLDTNNNEAVVILDPTSAEAVPVFDVVWTDDVDADNNFRGDYSAFDGHEYMTYGSTPLVDGNVAIFRFDETGAMDTIRLNGLTTELSIDDSVAVNPVDGSVWLPHNTGGNDRTYYRVDVASATLESPGVYLAGVTEEFTATDFNVGVNSLTFSPDGKWLAAAAPTGVDTLFLFRTTVPEPTSLVSALLAATCVAGYRRKSH
jgi:WD40 repeat protein